MSLALRERKRQQFLVSFERSFPWYQTKGKHWQQRWTQHRCRRSSDWERRNWTRSWWECYPLLIQNLREEEEKEEEEGQEEGEEQEEEEGEEQEEEEEEEEEGQEEEEEEE